MRSLEDRLFDIANSARLVGEYAAGLTRETLDTDTKTRDAIIYQLMIIGEATKNLPESWRSQHPSIEWSKIGRMRDRLIHNYHRVSNKIVWEVLTDEIPALRAYVAPFVTALLEETENDGSDS